MKRHSTLLSLALVAVSCAVSAQWQWVDKDGRKVFSDRAPPLDILDKDILSRPRAAPVAVKDSGAPRAQEAATDVPAVLPKQLAGGDKELEARRKAALDAEAAKRRADDDRVVKTRADNCTRAKQAKAMLDSGVRLSRTNAAGEAERMDDAARAAENKHVQGVIDSECK